MGSTARSLVLGLAARLPPSAVEPFVHSLRATSYQGKIGLVLAQYDSGELARMRELADFSIAVDIDYAPAPASTALTALRAIRTRRGLRRAYPAAFTAYTSLGSEQTSQRRWQVLEFALEGLQSLRYKHYYDILHSLGRDADEILLTDVRDVIFQSDPFAPPVAPLEVFLEEARVTIGGEPFNRRWIKGLYGPSVLEQLGDQTVSCSGTVIGRREGILRYLTEMWREIGWRRRPLGSHDQGIHNWLLRSGRLHDPLIVANGYGRVLTMGHMAGVRERADGKIENADGTIPAVLHQYDRDPARAARLRAAFRDSR